MKSHHPTLPTGQTLRRGVNASHWLGQHPPDRYADPNRFCENDVRWIANEGYDHVRIPVDGRILLDEHGHLRRDLLTPFDEALRWSEAAGLAVIFDMHYLEGTSFSENKGVVKELYTSDALMAKAASLWAQVAAYFHGRAPHMVFELLNEAVADEHEQLNTLNRRLLDGLRSEEPERMSLVSSNRWGKFENAPHLARYDDPNLAYAFHTYEPGFFTHQFAHWTPLPEVYPHHVPFPFTAAQLDPPAPLGEHRFEASATGADAAWVHEQFAHLAAWAAERDHPPILIDEFGTYHACPMASGWRWLQAIRDACETFGFGWTVWDYEGGFAIRDGQSGQPTYRHRALLSPTQEPPPNVLEEPTPAWIKRQP